MGTLWGGHLALHIDLRHVATGTAEMTNRIVALSFASSLQSPGEDLPIFRQYGTVGISTRKRTMEDAFPILRNSFSTRKKPS